MSGATARVLSRHAYPLLVLGLLVVLLAAFGVVEALGVPLLTDPVPALQAAGPAAALLSGGLLVADVVVPLPASVVMTVNGALFGVAAAAAVSVAGGTGATLVGLALGRRGRPVVDRLVPSGQQERAERLLRRHGFAALVATRPVPLLAETVAVPAGTTGLMAGGPGRAPRQPAPGAGLRDRGGAGGRRRGRLARVRRGPAPGPAGLGPHRPRARADNHAVTQAPSMAASTR